jgi:hypothetical protein
VNPELIDSISKKAIERVNAENTELNTAAWIEVYNRIFAELIIEECVAECEVVAYRADAVAKGTFVTDAGRMLHEGMWGGAKNCAARIKNRFGVTE